MDRTFIAIDLKSYYASVECVARGLDPLTTNLVVADASRTEKTICLAVSPSLKAYGIPGRARLFEVVQKVKEENARRLANAPGHKFTGVSFDANELASDSALQIDYVVATPQMRKYMAVSTQIYNIYLKYVSAEDIHVYSIDECFIDVTNYLKLHRMNPRELCKCMIQDVMNKTGITATGGIGTNMYLAKVAMDVMAKKTSPDEDGVRIAELNELSYREQLWSHEPITDFWRVGRGIAKKLAEYQIFTMGDVARVSVGLPPIEHADTESHIFLTDGRAENPDGYFNEKLLYRVFGVNAELLIDHAWGYEPTTIDMVKSFVPENNSISTGQVLPGPYEYSKAEIIVREMTDLLALDLVSKSLVADQIVLTIGYDIDNPGYKGEMITDYYGRKVPKSAHGSINLGKYSSLSSLIVAKTMELFKNIVNPKLLVRRITIAANHILPENSSRINRLQTNSTPADSLRTDLQILSEGFEETGAGGSIDDIYEDGEQLSLFTDYEARAKKRAEEKAKEEQEKNLQKAILSIQGRFGKNALLKGTNYLDGAMTRERNNQVGGHKG